VSLLPGGSSRGPEGVLTTPLSRATSVAIDAVGAIVVSGHWLPMAAVERS
jgi:hypothetical protein